MGVRVSDHQVRITRALLSVSDKTGLVTFAQSLTRHGVHILSTGGTARALREAGVAVTDVSDHTGFPEMMDGRVKTLHPKIHGGLLALRDQPEHTEAMRVHAIDPIDLVVVNLYPFEETVQKGASYEEAIETIDIGGPAMLRSAAKNHRFLTVVTDPADYALVMAEMDAHAGHTSSALRQRLAAKTYARTSQYDAAISAWFASTVLHEAFPEILSLPMRKVQDLRYGENPHQTAAVYQTLDAHGPSIITARCVQGKSLSYNNINDADAAFDLISEFDLAVPTVAIIKHANPCGVATGATAIEAYTRAYDCDRVSAFGGIIALNRPLDAQTATAITQIFTEVVLAPDADEEAQAIFAQKKNLRLLLTGGLRKGFEGEQTIKSISGGYLLQSRDSHAVEAAQIRCVTQRSPTPEEMRDLLFAWRVAKHVKSNAIVYAKGGGTVGIGAGQMNRLNSSQIAAQKSRDAAEALGVATPLAHGSVVASDAFFPFPDGLIAAADAGVTAIIQPGGAMRDADVIAAADARGLAMVLTGIRHFRH